MNFLDGEAQASCEREKPQTGERFTNDLLLGVSYPALLWVYGQSGISFTPVTVAVTVMLLCTAAARTGQKGTTYHLTIRREATVSSYARSQPDRLQKRGPPVAVVPEDL